MINVCACGRVAFDGAEARNPIADGLGLGGSCKAEANRFVVQEGKAVVVKDAVQINGSEAAGLFIPETMRAIVTNFGSVLSEIGWIESIRAASDAPFGMFDDVFLQFGEAEYGIVIVNGRERVFTAERKDVPV